MSQVEILIIAQVALIFIVAIVVLVLCSRRQKKTIARLQSMLSGYQEEASGETLIKQLQLAIDDTTAHCAQETIELRPDSSAEDQAISLRYSALTYELRHLQSNNGEVSPWRTIIQPYNELAAIYFKHIESIPEKVTIKFKGQMADMDKEQRRLEEESKELKSELAKLAPISDFFKQEFDEDVSKNEVELSLHNALVALCDTVDHAEGLREVVYLLHEAYYEHGSTPSDSTTIESAPPTESGGNHTGALGKLINEQNTLIQNLRSQLSKAEGLEGGSELMAHLDVLEQNFAAAQIQISNLEAQLKEARANGGPDSDNESGGTDEDPDYSQDEMFELIEQFTEESADMVERLHLLQNQNKQYIKENDELREQVLATTEDPDEEQEPLVAGLKMRLETQDAELLQLQNSFKEVEDKYLALYEDTMKDMIAEPPSATATTEEAKGEAIAAPTDNNEPPTADDPEDQVSDESDIDAILAQANIDTDLL